MSRNSFFGSLISRSILGIVALLGATGLSAAAPSSAFALPVLQVYVEGGSYDTTTDTWTLSSGSDSVRVWVIGNTEGSGGKGTISDAGLVISYDSPVTSPTITVDGTTTAGFGGITDPSTAADGTYVGTVTDGSTPTGLQPHGVFGDGREYQEFALGDFTLSDSAIGDFQLAFPSTLEASAGQINVYDISFSGYDGPFHFDVYGTIVGPKGAEIVKASPNSHDGEFTNVPEISTGSDATSALTLLLGAAAVFLTPRRRRA